MAAIFDERAKVAICVAIFALTAAAQTQSFSVAALGDRRSVQLMTAAGRKPEWLLFGQLISLNRKSSPAMRAHGMRQPRWTRVALDAFLADPQCTMPENAMGFFGIKGPAERPALLDFLATR